MLTFAASDADPHRFRLAEAKDVEPFLSRVKDPALRHALGFGVGIVTETMSEAERGVVDLLFESGAVQVRGEGGGHMGAGEVTREGLLRQRLGAGQRCGDRDPLWVPLS